MNNVLRKRMKNHRKTLNWKESRIKQLKSLENMYIGECRGIHDNDYVVFNIQANIITVLDMKEGKQNIYDFRYDMKTGEYKGKGVRNRFKDCERFICYILLMKEENHENGNNFNTGVH